MCIRDSKNVSVNMLIDSLFCRQKLLIGKHVDLSLIHIFLWLVFSLSLLYRVLSIIIYIDHLVDTSNYLLHLLFICFFFIIIFECNISPFSILYYLFMSFHFFSFCFIYTWCLSPTFHHKYLLTSFCRLVFPLHSHDSSVLIRDQWYFS